MNWITVVVSLAFIVQIFADPITNPDPKKYKPENLDKTSKISEEEKQFIKDIEAKFNVSPNIDSDANLKFETVETNKKISSKEPSPKSFPAVIAIEIVDDNNTETKGKRTIDANLGYGYRTNTGYTYTYFGQPKQEQGKFMIYPYSQHDIPSRLSNNIKHQRPQPTFVKSQYQYNNGIKAEVEIQPSKAYELVPVDEPQRETYSAPYGFSEIKNMYEHIKAIETPPPIPFSHAKPASTLYTTYNGQEISGLSGKFPTVMPQYFVDSNQLIKSPHFQNVGITSDHLRAHGNVLSQPVIPVLVLRIPSSQIKNPTAELFPNLPQNYPHANYLNNVNLQALVSQYLKEHGMISEFIPHPRPVSRHYGSPIAPTRMQYEPIQYVPQQQALYTKVPTVHPSPTAQAIAAQYQNDQVHISYQNQHEIPSQGHRETQVQYIQEENVVSKERPVYEEQPQHQTENGYQVYYEVQGKPSAESEEAASPLEHREQLEQHLPHSSEHSQQQIHQTQTERGMAYSYQEFNSESEKTQQAHYVSSTEPIPTHQAIVNSYSESGFLPIIPTEGKQKHVSISENYPSPHHTQVVLPKQYEQPHLAREQSVMYVTPSPQLAKYYPYRVMAPQPILGHYNQASLRHSPQQIKNFQQNVFRYGNSNPEYETLTDFSYVPPVGNQKPPLYPRNHHSNFKRTVKPIKNSAISTTNNSQKKGISIVHARF